MVAWCLGITDLNKKYFINPFTILKIDKKTFHQTSNLSKKDVIIFISTKNSEILKRLKKRRNFNQKLIKSLKQKPVLGEEILK